MDRILRYAAYTANVLLVFGAIILMLKSYSSRDMLLSALVMVPGILSVIALWEGPDREERKLRRQVAKARLARELRDLTDV